MPSLTFPFIPVCHFNLIRHASLDNPIVYSGRARRHACLVEGYLPALPGQSDVSNVPSNFVFGIVHECRRRPLHGLDTFCESMGAGL